VPRLTTNMDRDFQYEVDERSVTFDVEESVYPLDAIYGAAYLFIDRCFVFLSRTADAVVSVRLKTKEKTTTDDLDALAGEFANELLNQSFRARLAESTGKIREYYVARAFFGEPRVTSIDAILAELDKEELHAGDVEVHVPWKD
jgi:His-Xaa-Ser system protein HxsD